MKTQRRLLSVKDAVSFNESEKFVIVKDEKASKTFCFSSSTIDAFSVLEGEFFHLRGCGDEALIARAAELRKKLELAGLL